MAGKARKANSLCPVNPDGIPYTNVNLTPQHLTYLIDLLDDQPEGDELADELFNYFSDRLEIIEDKVARGLVNPAVPLADEIPGLYVEPGIARPA
jgi:hypothetical protein